MYSKYDTLIEIENMFRSRLKYFSTDVSQMFDVELCFTEALRRKVRGVLTTGFVDRFLLCVADRSPDRFLRQNATNPLSVDLSGVDD